jgi:hypothetical protein
VRKAQFRLGALIGAKSILSRGLMLTLDNTAYRTTLCRRKHIQVSALSTFVGSVLDYHGVDG